MPAPEVDSISPTPDYTGFPVSGYITVVFTTELASNLEDSIFLMGPNSSEVTGPGMEFSNIDGKPFSSDGDSLNSPGFSGVVEVDYEVSVVDSAGSEVSGSVYEFADITNRFTKVTIRPCQILDQDTTYTLYLGGGPVPAQGVVSSRSVLDAKADAGNSGSGVINTKGFYYNASQATDTINIEITRSGNQNTARYDWWYSSDAPTVYNNQASFVDKEIDTDLFLSFDGDFEDGDIYTINVGNQDSLASTYKLSFSTGSDQIVDLNTEHSSSPIGVSTSTSFEVVSVTPSNGASHLPLGTGQVIVKFSKDIDPATFDFGSISLTRYHVDGSEKVNVPFSYIVESDTLIINIVEHNA